MVLYRARTVATAVEGEPAAVHDAAVAVDDGVVVEVGGFAAVRRRHSDFEARDLGDVVLMPAFVNAHAHLELAWAGDDPPVGGDYTAWVEALVAGRPRVDADTVDRACREALRFSRSRGTIAIGDVANTPASLPVLAASDSFAVVFYEVVGLRTEVARSALASARDACLRHAGDRASTGGRVGVVPAPHAPHTVSREALRAIAALADRLGRPYAIHVAESAAECRRLADGGGPLAGFFERRAFEDAAWRAPEVSPIAYLDRLGALTSRTRCVHAVHASSDDVRRIASRGASVVTCPRSNAYLDVGTAPVATYLDAGIDVALGTDSPASGGDLDTGAELAALRAAHPTIAPGAALRIATANGARALGLPRLGAIERGRLAAMIAVSTGPLAPDDALDAATSDPGDVRWVHHPIAGAEAMWSAS